MGQVIGPSTSTNTATLRADINGPEPASFRYNNPGAQYPSGEAAAFGQTGYGIIGGGHKIARFPSPVNGAASNFDLLFRVYAGMTIGAAGKKWTGANGFGVPGYDPTRILTRELLRDPDTAIAFLKAIAGRESGKGTNLSDFQWRQAHDMFLAGSADNYLAKSKAAAPTSAPAAKTGEALLARARKHIGEDYENVLVPKDDPNWKGPWDCAEFVSWVVFQETGQLFGCVDSKVPPSKAEAYTGAWRDDLEAGRVILVSIDKAAGTPGGILLRYPPDSQRMGHIAFCDGLGGTVEAKGQRYGVVEDSVQGRSWDAGILIPGITYTASSPVPIRAPANVYRLGAPNMDAGVLAAIKVTLAARGFYAGAGTDFDAATRNAVIDFQRSAGLVVDGEVGSETAEALDVSLIPGTNTAPDQAKAPEPVLPTLQQILQAILTIVSGAGATPMSSQTTLSSALERLGEILKTLQSQGATPQPAQPMSDEQKLAQLRELILQVLPALGLQVAKASGSPVLGQVNGALGQTIGNLLDGKKTAIGILGALATQLLSALSGTDSALGKVLLSLAPSAGLSQFALPLFLAMTVWGALGKAEKWAQGSVPASANAPKTP